MPTITVDTAAADRSLITLAAAKAELGIVGSEYDARLTGWIKAGSDAVAAACRIAADQAGRRSMISEAIDVAFRPSEIPVGVAPLILPWRIPLTVTTVTVGESTLTVATDVEAEPISALLWRIDSSGDRCCWERTRIVITACAGWAQGEVPEAARQAALRWCRERYDGDGRNSLLKAEEVDGIGRDEFWVGGGRREGDLPDDVCAALQSAGLVAPWGT